MKRHAPSTLSVMGLAAASWETIARRSMLMATGRCSPAEYQRMMTEKAQANWAAGIALMTRRRRQCRRRALPESRPRQRQAAQEELIRAFPATHPRTRGTTMQVASPQQVLLIEGHPDLRMVLGFAIEDAGFTARTAASVDAGLDAMRDQPHTAAVILDADNDPDMAAASAIRTTWPATAVVVMLDGTVPSTLPTGVAYISRLSLARDVGGTLHRVLKDTPGAAMAQAGGQAGAQAGAQAGD